MPNGRSGLGSTSLSSSGPRTWETNNRQQDSSHTRQFINTLSPLPQEAETPSGHGGQGQDYKRHQTTVTSIHIYIQYEAKTAPRSTVVRACARDAGGRCSIPDRVTPKTLKMGGLRFSAWRLALMS